MGGGGGKNTSTQSSSSPYAAALWGLGSKYAKGGLPLFNQSVGQAEQAIQTGGVNSNIPSINRSVDASREASSQATEQTRQSLARLGLTDTPFAQEILSQNRQTSSNQIANIGPEMASNIANRAPSLIGLGEGGFSPMSTAASLDTTQTSTPSFWSQFSQMLQGAQQTGAQLGTVAAG